MSLKLNDAIYNWIKINNNVSVNEGSLNDSLKWKKVTLPNSFKNESFQQMKLHSPGGSDQRGVSREKKQVINIWHSNFTKLICSQHFHGKCKNLKYCIKAQVWMTLSQNNVGKGILVTSLLLSVKELQVGHLKPLWFLRGNENAACFSAHFIQCLVLQRRSRCHLTYRVLG